jgi:hypothetical protein
MTSPTFPHFCSLLLLLLPLLPTVFNFTQDDCLSLKSPAPWASRSGEFALGLISPVSGTQNFLLAVWFNKIQDRTIVWSANGNKPAPLSSQFKLTSNGEFVLDDPAGKTLWKPKTNGSKARCAAMLDNGNFVILDENYSPIWESFKEPTDTILPGQILDMPSTLRSRQSETDYADGGFELSLQLDGNLVLYLVSEKFRSAYWATTKMNWKSQLVFDEAGQIYIKDSNTSATNFLTSEDPGSSQIYYHIARLDQNGVFKLYKHLRNEN